MATGVRMLEAFHRAAADVADAELRGDDLGREPARLRRPADGGAHPRDGAAVSGHERRLNVTNVIPNVPLGASGRPRERSCGATRVVGDEGCLLMSMMTVFL